MEVAGDPVPHADREVGAEEETDLAEVDGLARVVVASRPQNYEQDAAVVLLELGPQVEALRVLDGEVVQTEAVLHL
jgi:hypothetical protein